MTSRLSRSWRSSTATAEDDSETAVSGNVIHQCFMQLRHWCFRPSSILVVLLLALCGMAIMDWRLIALEERFKSWSDFRVKRQQLHTAVDLVLKTQMERIITSHLAEQRTSIDNSIRTAIDTNIGKTLVERLAMHVDDQLFLQLQGAAAELITQQVDTYLQSIGRERVVQAIDSYVRTLEIASRVVTSDLLYALEHHSPQTKGGRETRDLTMKQFEGIQSEQRASQSRHHRHVAADAGLEEGSSAAQRRTIPRRRRKAAGDEPQPHDPQPHDPQPHEPLASDDDRGSGTRDAGRDRVDHDMPAAAAQGNEVETNSNSPNEPAESTDGWINAEPHDDDSDDVWSVQQLLGTEDL